MKITKIGTDKEFDLKFEDALSTIEKNRERVRSLSNMILSSCSIFLPISFVILFFVIKETELKNFIVPGILILSDVILIISIFFSISSVYTKEPKAITTKFNLISQQTYYYIREQRNARISIIFLFIGIVLFLISLIIFAVEFVK